MDDMNHLYSLYRRTFPGYPVTEAVFSRIVDRNAAVLTSNDEHGNVIGFAVVREHSISLLCVDEAHRRHGIGSNLLGLAEKHIKHSGGERITLGQGNGYIFQGVPEEHPEAVVFFQKHGYTAEWSSVNMRIDLTAFDPAAVNIPLCPDGLSFRYACADDKAELLRAVASVDENWLKYFNRGTDPVLIAVRNGKIVGFEFVSTEDVRFDFPGEKSGSVGCVGVIPFERRHGIGLRMVAEGLSELKKHGCTMSELLYVELADWYARLGFEIMHRQWMGTKEI